MEDQSNLFEVVNLKERALDHYDKMIEFVTNYNYKKSNALFSDYGEQLYYTMRSAIEQNWGGMYCSYCKVFFNHFTGSCNKYPLLKKGSRISGKYIQNCCDGYWTLMNRSTNKREWLKYAKRIKKIIEERG